MTRFTTPEPEHLEASIEKLEQERARIIEEEREQIKAKLLEKRKAKVAERATTVWGRVLNRYDVGQRKLDRKLRHTDLLVPHSDDASEIHQQTLDLQGLKGLSEFERLPIDEQVEQTTRSVRYAVGKRYKNELIGISYNRLEDRINHTSNEEYDITGPFSLALPSVEQRLHKPYVLQFAGRRCKGSGSPHDRLYVTNAYLKPDPDEPPFTQELTHGALVSMNPSERYDLRVAARKVTNRVEGANAARYDEYE